MKVSEIMSTSFSEPYDVFFNRIEEDKDFFLYNNVSTEEAIALANQRAKNYLIESASKIMMSCNSDINFNSYDKVIETFNVDLTTNEINLLAQLMFEQYLSRDFVKLKAYKTRFTTSDLNMVTPSTERSTFLNMYTFVQSQSEKMLDDYKSRDRITGILKGIDYSSYSDN